MLIKDNILAEKLTHTTRNTSICVELSFELTNAKTFLKFVYIPDKYKIVQTSIPKYVQELLESEKFDLENLSARIVEDLYDIAVPKHIEATLTQEVHNIKTSITTNKAQPGVKLIK